MPKIQGKQIADQTLEQKHLSLETPLSADTSAAATVEYVNDKISTSSGVIGEAEDGTYTDGIFTDFTPETPTGTAIDRFNEMFLLLAPAPPAEGWDNVFSGLDIDSTTYSANQLTTGTVASNITTDTTPAFSLNVTLGTSGRLADIGTFTVTDSVNGQLDTVSLTTGDDTRVGIISLTEGDPYDGQEGKAGFWSAITSMSVNGTISPAITPSETQHTTTFTHPGIDTPEETDYYVDVTQTPVVSVPTFTAPSMTGFVSGIPTLTAGTVVNDIAFTIDNAVSYFYNPNIFDIIGDLINNSTTNPPTVIPTTPITEQVSESGHSVTVANGQFSDTSFGFTVTGRSADGTSGTNTATSSTLRVDTVSNETIRVTSGSGNYPVSGYDEVYDSSVSLVGAYSSEMMLRNGAFIYPDGNYTTFGGPNYSSVTGTRWTTFNLGAVSISSAFTLTFSGAAGFTGPFQSNILIEVKVDGATSSFWIDGGAAYSGTGNPGSGSDGIAGLVFGSSTATVKRITVGVPQVAGNTFVGNLIVRVGFTGTGTSFSSVSVSNII